jgi:hypothetical protein
MFDGSFHPRMVFKVFEIHLCCMYCSYSTSYASAWKATFISLLRFWQMLKVKVERALRNFRDCDSYDSFDYPQPFVMQLTSAHAFKGYAWFCEA